MVAHAGTVLDNVGNRPAVEMLEARLTHATADERGVAVYMLIGPIHVRREVHLDLEQLPEVLVDGVQEVEQC